MTAVLRFGAEASPAGQRLCDIEAEAAFLGAILTDSALLDSFPDLRPDHFAMGVHARICAAVREERNRGAVATPVTLRARFEGDEGLRDLGGTSYLARLTADTTGLLAARELAEHLINLGERRRIIAAASDLNYPLDRIEVGPAGAGSRVQATPYQWTEAHSLPVRPWLYGRWLLRGTLATVVAPGGVGKSTFLAATALALATGRELLGKVTWGGPKRVWLWNLEDDLDELARSVQAAALHYGISRDEIAGRLFVDSAMDGSELCTATTRDGHFQLLRPVYDRLTAELLRRGIDALIIDPFVSSHDADENDNGRIDKIAKAWARVAKAANCSVVLVHHASKAGSEKVTANSSRGAVSLIAAARTTLVLNRIDENDAKRLGVSARDRRRYLSVRDDKSNRAAAVEAEWFRLASVDLGNASAAMPSDSVGVVEPWKLPNPFDDVTIEDLRRVQAQAIDPLWRKDPQSPEWIGNLVAKVLGLDLEEQSDSQRTKAIVREWIRSGALHEVEAKEPSKRQIKKFVISGDPA